VRRAPTRTGKSLTGVAPISKLAATAGDDLVLRLGQCWPVEAWQDVSVLVGVSGGADSVALLVALSKLKTRGEGRLHAAHFHHGLRGADADEDARFVQQLARKRNLPCRLGHADAEAIADSADGPEAGARQARYAFLRQTAERVGARYVVTAHTADDQVETVLHRILRGTGIAGLAGIRPIRPLGPAVTVVRPLLQTARAEVIDFLRAVDQPFRQDASNRDDRFLRNRIRHELLPLLRRRYADDVDQALRRLAALAGEAQQVVDQLVAELAVQAVIRRCEQQCLIRVENLVGEPRYLVRELLIHLWRQSGWPEQAMGFAQWEELAELALGAEPAKRMFPGSITAERSVDHLSLWRP